MPRAEWMPVQVELSRKPATIALARALGINGREAVGLMLEVWAWARTATADGFVPNVPPAWLDRAFGVAGLGAALASPAVGWLEVDPDGREGLRFPEWDVWLGGGVRARLLSAERSRRSRRKRKQAGADQLTPPLELTPQPPPPVLPPAARNGRAASRRPAR